MNPKIDDLFKQALHSDADMLPEDVERDPEATWQRIEAGLPRQKRRRQLWLALAATAFIAVGMIWWTQGGPDRTEEPLLAEAVWTPFQQGHVYRMIPAGLRPGGQMAIGYDADRYGWRADSVLVSIPDQTGDSEKGGSETEDGLQEKTEESLKALENLGVKGKVEYYAYSGNAKANGYASGSGTYTVQTQDMAIGGRLRRNTITLGTSNSLSNNYRLRSQEQQIVFEEKNRGYFSTYQWTPNGEFESSEYYKALAENAYTLTLDEAVTTFSVDVDRASYSNHRRFLNQGSLPPVASIRPEEFLNYFAYSYPAPTDGKPVAAHLETGPCPWAPEHQLIRIGLKAKELAPDPNRRSNLVFLLDVSGSMDSPDKLPLLKTAMGKLVQQLSARDHVSIVVYAGAAGAVLMPTSGADKATIMAALDRLEAGGSTAGAEGIELAYQLAMQNFDPGGNNRIILATDGDFNVGVSSDKGLEELIEEKRKTGIFLTVIGLGTGNYQDAKMETLADKGNGNFGYLDSEKEAEKFLVEEFGATMFTVAKDVKVQVEFNPALVQKYRLIGYENRALANEDFEDDTKDAGEMGAGHTVTALYEIVPVPQASGGKYSTIVKNANPNLARELCTLRFRWKDPEGSKSQLMEVSLPSVSRIMPRNSLDFRFQTAVAAYALILSQSVHRGEADWTMVRDLARNAIGTDPGGYRREFLELVEKASLLMPALEHNADAEDH